MKICPLGVGGAFTKSNYHNNYIIELDGTFLLVDAGTTLRNSLPEAGYHYLSVDFVFISHLHSDHVGGLEELIMRRFWHFEEGQHQPKKTTLLVHERLLNPIRAYLNNGLGNQGRTADDFCNFIPLKNEEIFSIHDFQLSLFDTTNYHVDGMISAGFKLASKNCNIVFTADVKQLEAANILGQVDGSTAAIFQDVSFTSNGVHATLQEVLDYYPRNMHPMLYAMHYNDNFEEFKDVLDQANIRYVKKQEILEF